VEELFDMAMAFSGQALPASPRTAVITNSGGPGILAADALEAAQLELAELQPQTLEHIRTLLPQEASVRNPLDLIATAQPDVYRRALEALLCDPGVAAVLAIFVPPLGIRQEDVAEAIVAAAQTCPGKPVLSVLMGREGLPQGRAELQDANIPAYLFPESAARALAALNRYRRWLDRPAAPAPRLEVDRKTAVDLVAQALAGGRTRLTALEALELVRAYGIPVVETALATSAEQAVSQSKAMGFPVVMKVASEEIIHKTDIGGVALGLADEADVRTAFGRLVAVAERTGSPAAARAGVLVQQHAAAGVEMIAGLSRDTVFGPLIMFGLGGIFVEALHDVIFRLAPIDALEAAEMVQGTRSAHVLKGVRGQPPADQDALIDALCRLSLLAVELPQVAELDLNPLMALPDGVLVLDARVTLRAS
jgi:acetyltransferase